MQQRSLYRNTLNRQPYGSFYKPTSPPGISSARPESQGLKDAKKEKVKIEEINKDRFHNLVKASNHTLFKISSVFPFDLFTDEISIEITQINVIKRFFFATAHLQTIPIKNVADIFVQTSLIFASLRIIDSSYIENSIQVDNLKKDDACMARIIIQGLVVANKEGIDLAKIPRSTLMEDIESLGKTQSVNTAK
jgi:hypothetical protein